MYSLSSRPVTYWVPFLVTFRNANSHRTSVPVVYGLHGEPSWKFVAVSVEPVCHPYSVRERPIRGAWIYCVINSGDPIMRENHMLRLGQALG